MFRGYKNNNLYCQWYGSAGNENVALLMLHGLGTDSREFGSFPEMLSKMGLPVLCFDLSGHGKSEGKPGFLSRDVHMQDTRSAVRFLSTKGYKKVIVLGHSFGAHAALMAVSEIPEVAGGILVAPQIRSGDSLRWLKKALFYIAGVSYKLLPFLPDVYISNKANYEGIFSDYDCSVRAQKAGFIAPKINLRICQYALKADNRKYVIALRKPVLFIACAQDKQIPFGRVKMLSDMAPPKTAHFSMLPRAGHSPFMDRDSETLADEVFSFCSNGHRG